MMRKDHRKTLDHELELYDSAFMSYAFQWQYQFVEGIIRRGDLVEFCQYTQKDAQGPGNTLEPALGIQDAAFVSYAFHYQCLLVEGITRRGDMVEASDPLKSCARTKGTRWIPNRPIQLRV